MAYLEINCSNFTYENNKIYIDLLQENVTDIDAFTHTSELYMYIQYAYKLTNGEIIYDVLFENNITLIDGTYSQTDPLFFIKLTSNNNVRYIETCSNKELESLIVSKIESSREECGIIQVACNHTPTEVKLIISTSCIEIITPSKESKTIVSTNDGYSTIDYSFKTLVDINSAKVFCKDVTNGNVLTTYYFGGLNEYGRINAGVITSNTIDVRDMFTELIATNGKLYTIGIEVEIGNRFYSYNWVDFILSDGQYMNVL